jgi:hypothetical protein
MTEGKQKLTLSVDAESVERAKALGINISDLTEQVLRSFTLRPGDAAEGALQAQRESLFQEMTPLLKTLRAEVHIGSVDDPNGNDGEDFLDVVLTGNGKPMVLAPDPDYDFDLAPVDPSGYGRIYFDSSEVLIRNFMKAVEEAKIKQKQQVASFVLARKIVEAVTQAEKSAQGPAQAERAGHRPAKRVPQASEPQRSRKKPKARGEA